MDAKEFKDQLREIIFEWQNKGMNAWGITDKIMESEIMKSYHKLKIFLPPECTCKCDDKKRKFYPLTNIAYHLPYNICHYCGKAVITEYGKQSLQPKDNNQINIK